MGDGFGGFYSAKSIWSNGVLLDMGAGSNMGSTCNSIYWLCHNFWDLRRIILSQKVNTAFQSAYERQPFGNSE